MNEPLIVDRPLDTNVSLKRILISRIHDVRLDADLRMQSYLKLIPVAFPDEVDDVLNRYDQLIYLHTQYELPPSTMDLIHLLVLSNDVSSHWRYNMVMAMFVNDYYDYSYDLMLKLGQDPTLADGYRADFILILYATDEYRDAAEVLLIQTITNLKEDKVNTVSMYWYRFIMDTIAHKPIKVVGLNSTLIANVDDHFINQYLLAYMRNTSLIIEWRMQCAQLLLMRYGEKLLESTEQETNEVITFLKELITSHYDNETIVGEAYDILIRCDTDRHVQWEQALLAYGNRHRQNTEGYAHNTQNVHMFADQALLHLDILCARSKKPLPELELEYGQFESWVYSLLLKFGKPVTYQDQVLHSLSRLYLDTSKLGRHHISPRGLVVLVKEHIVTEDQQKLLIDELMEMNGTCTTGHYVRLIGILANESETPYRITFSDQLASNLDGRIRAKIRALSDDHHQVIVEDVMESSDDRRPQYQTILQPILVDLYVNLRMEFVDSGHLTVDEFDRVFHQFQDKWN